MSVLKEFKEFAIKGNVVDMAVGVIIGGAFGKIVSSLVGDVIMPAVSTILGGQSFAEKAIEIPSKVEGAEPILIKYGLFLQNIIDFVIMINYNQSLNNVDSKSNIIILHLEKIGVLDIVNNIRGRQDLNEEIYGIINEFISFFNK